MRARLATALGTEFDAEMKRSLGNINTAIEPYSRFIRAETTNLRDAQQKMNDLKLRLINLREQIQLEWEME